MGTKAKIIESAIELFSKKGYTETSVREISELSGIKASSMYNHFQSKEEILNHILQMYIDQTKEITLDKESVDKLAQTQEPKKILMDMFYRFNKKEAQMYTRILKIILHEQYRNEHVGNFFREHFLIEMENYIQYTIQKLVEYQRIPAVNYRYYAKILNDLCIASTMNFSHFSGSEGYSLGDRILLDDVLEFMIDHILKDTTDIDLPRTLCPGQGKAKWLKQKGGGDD